MSDFINTMLSGTLKGWLYLTATVVIFYFCFRLCILFFKSWRNMIKNRKELEENRKWRKARIEREFEFKNWDY